MISDKKLLIIDGPSAVGKSTIVNLLLKNESPEFVIAKRVTTREKRDSPEDDLSYDFVSKAEFENMIKNNRFVEYHHYLFGMSYGLPIENVIKLLNQGCNVIGIINLGNIEMVRKIFPNCFGVFIKTSLSTIKNRLAYRNIHSIDEINERLENASKSAEFEKYYDLVIFNDGISPEKAVSIISDAFLAHQNIKKNGR